MSGKKEELDVDLLELKKSANNLKNAIEKYEAYSKNPFEEDLEELDKMNSDFISKLYYMLDEINGDAVELSDDYKNIAKIAAEISKNFKKVDEEQAQSIKKGGGKK